MKILAPLKSLNQLIKGRHNVSLPFCGFVLFPLIDAQTNRLSILLGGVTLGETHVVGVPSTFSIMSSSTSRFISASTLSLKWKRVLLCAEL